MRKKSLQKALGADRVVKGRKLHGPIEWLRILIKMKKVVDK